jgi:hypothetical protein
VPSSLRGCYWRVTVEKPLQLLVDEIKNRSLIYRRIYEQLAAVFGPEQAIRLMGDAIYERGRDKGRALAKKIGEPNLAKVAQAFAQGKHEMDAFGHEVVAVTGTEAVLRLNRCPLSEAWDEAGLSAKEKATMCDIASRVDFGKFEAAGYRLRFACRIADGAAMCDLHLTKG